uniref:Peptidase A1 domain-containing protein n=1 Tax=Ascaris lumbricoides TaxID=6252 RepID=A0A0M3IQK2_ASCLU
MLLLALAIAHALRQFWCAYKSTDLSDSASLESVSTQSCAPSAITSSVFERQPTNVEFSKAMCDDDITALVVDNGSGMCKACGFNSCTSLTQSMCSKQIR